MDSRDVTRRTLLGGIAAAGAVSLVRPGAGLAAVIGSPGSVSRRWVGTFSGELAPIQAPRRFALVGLQWTGPAGAKIELRAQAPNGRWSPWVGASTLGHDGDGQSAPGALYGEPVWTGAADRVQLRSARRVHGLRVHFVSAQISSAGSSGPGARSSVAFAAALPVLDAGPGQPAILGRGAWAAGQTRPVHRPEYGTVKLAFVHHTVNPNGYGAAAVPSMLRAIFDYHVHVRGFWDIAYNFIIDAYGRIWEARAGGIDTAVIGAHAGAYNAESTGIAVLGDFMNVVPPPPAIGALQRLAAWKLSLHGLPSYGRATVIVDPAGAFYTPFAPGAHVSLPRVAGHRDGDSTDCPGNAFYGRLPAIRPGIAALAGTPARLTMRVPTGGLTAGAQVMVSGLLRLLSGAPVGGAPIELQRLGANGPRRRTFASATTLDDGSWSTSLTLAHNATVRALHRRQPAAVADWVLIAVAPALTVAAESISPLRISGTISPSKRHVTVDLYSATGSRRKPLVSRRASIVQGRFSSVLPVPRSGSYVVVARSRADANNAAGASAPLDVTVP